jgi:cation:H+ antiporter
MLLATAALTGIAFFNGAIEFRTGAALFTGIVAYIIYMGFRAHATAGNDPLLDDVEEYAAGQKLSARTFMYLIGGLIGLPIGAHLLVTHGSILAADLGVREAVIGLTIIAFGTSLPELATVVAAALHKKSDVAIGGVIGSNIFNILAVGGAAGLAGRAPFDETALGFDIPIMIAATLVLAGFVFARRNIGRLSGLLMFGAYIAFVSALALKAA